MADKLSEKNQLDPLQEIQSLIEAKRKEEQNKKQAEADKKARIEAEAALRQQQQAEAKRTALLAEERQQREQLERYRLETEQKFIASQYQIAQERLAELQRLRALANAEAFSAQPFPWLLIIAMIAGFSVVSFIAVHFVVQAKRKQIIEQRSDYENRIKSMHQEFGNAPKIYQEEVAQKKQQLAKIQEQIDEIEDKLQGRLTRQKDREAAIRAKDKAADLAAKEKARKSLENDRKLNECMKHPDDPICGL